MARSLIASDNFDRANGSLGPNWSNLHPFWGSPSIVSNKCQVGGSVSSGGSAARWNGAGTFAGDQYAKALIGAFDWDGGESAAGVGVRMSADVDGARDGYSFWAIDNGGAPPASMPTQLRKVVNGTVTVLDSTPNNTWNNGHTIEIEAEGSTIRGFQNGTETHIATDSSLTTGKPGICGGGTKTLDDWEGGDLVTASGAEDTVSPGALTLTGGSGLAPSIGAVNTVAVGALVLAGAAGLAQRVGAAKTVTAGTLTLAGAAGIGYIVGTAQSVTPGTLLLAAASGLATAAGASIVVTAGALLLVGGIALAAQGSGTIARAARVLRGVITRPFRGVRRDRFQQ